MIRLLALAIILGTTAVVTTAGASAERGGGPGTALAIGFALIAASLTGDLFERFRLPRISGYLFFGVVCGPYAGAILTPAMARELAMAHVETQMGVARTEALKNIYRRTGSESMQSLTAMLIQADRFGTSIAQALRIYSESLRVKRRYKAEERAATAAVKISFPLVLFVFPALLIVIGTPAFLRIKELNVF